MNVQVLETILFWSAVVVYAAATLFAVAGLVFGSQKAGGYSWVVTLMGFGIHTASLAVRWVGSGRLPYVEQYENIVAGTWFVMVAFIALGFWRPALRVAGVGVLAFTVLSLGYASTLPSASGPVTAPYKSVWLGVHVLFAWATYAAYTTCAALGLVEILKSRRGRSPAPGSWLDRAPDAERLGELTFRFVGYGFLVNGVMIASGAIWAYDLWGSYWSWDPVETWSLLTWLAYGLYLHGRITLGWRGVRLAWIAVLALFGVLMTFWGVQLLPSSYHLFRSLGENVPQVGRPQ